MAKVFLAEDVSLHRKVAIKVLGERYAEDAQFVERFQREARAAAGLNHPNIVQVYDHGRANGSYYIAMEYLEGPTLDDVIADEGHLPPRRAIDLTLQILAALRFAHRHGVVHRDVKPQNMILLRDGRVKVTDFGIARAGSSEMTEAGSIIGTAQYISPEQARGLPVGPPADLYSVGVVLYKMLDGARAVRRRVGRRGRHAPRAGAPGAAVAPQPRRAARPRARRHARAGEGRRAPLPDGRRDGHRPRPRAQGPRGLAADGGRHRRHHAHGAATRRPRRRRSRPTTASRRRRPTTAGGGGSRWWVVAVRAAR